MTTATKTKAKTPDFERISSEVRESAHKIWLAGLGALSVAEEEGGKLFKTLVEKGQDFESKGRDGFDKVRTSVEDAASSAREKIGSAWQSFESGFDEKVSAAIHRIGVPTREEIHTLTKRVEELTKAVDALRDKKA